MPRKGCYSRLKAENPEIDNYLRSKAGVDYDEKTGAGKQEWAKAIREFQNETLNAVEDVYRQVGVKGYEKAATAPEAAPITTVVKENVEKKKAAIQKEYQGKIDVLREEQKAGESKSNISAIRKEIDELPEHYQDLVNTNDTVRLANIVAKINESKERFTEYSDGGKAIYKFLLDSELGSLVADRLNDLKKAKEVLKEEFEKRVKKGFVKDENTAIDNSQKIKELEQKRDAEISELEKPTQQQTSTPIGGEQEIDKPKIRVTAEQVEERQPENIRQRYLDDFNVPVDSKYNWTFSSVLTAAERKKAVADIKAGKNSAPAKKLNQEIEETISRGTVIINRGRGSAAEQVEIPVNQWFQLSPIEQNQTIQEAENTEIEDNFISSIVRNNEITLQNIDDLKNLFNGFPYNEQDFAAVKTFLSGETTGITQTESISQEGQQPAADEEIVTQTIAEQGKDLAAKIRQLKTKRDTLQANIFGIPIAIYDGLIETIATAVENGALLADAIKSAIDTITDKRFDKAGFKNHVEDFMAGEKPGVEVQVGEEGTPEIIEERRFAKRVLSDEDILPEAKEKLEKNKDYIRQVNALSVAEAKKIIDEVGAEEAYDLVVNDINLKPAVRVVMGETLIKKFNDLAVKADNPIERNHYVQRTSDIADFVSEHLGTIPGQIIQALSLYSRLTPEAQLLSANKEVKKQGAKAKKKREKDVNNLGDKLKKANEETVDEVSKKVKPKVENTDSKRKSKAKENIQKARDKRKKLIEKYKSGKGKSLFSSPTGLTPEGIEFVGEVALTYFQEGIANVQLIADKIIEHLKDIGGKSPNDEAIRNVNSIVQQVVDQESNKKIAKGLSELEKEVSRTVREHYTVPTDKKQTLTDKFVEQVGLDKDDAIQLSREIQEEFDRIATRKKNDILYKEKERFDRIQNGLKGAKKVERKTLHDEIIKYSNLGAFENDEFLKFLADKLGVGQLTPEEGKKITELAEKVQKAPEGSPKNDATQDLLAYRANLNGISWGETIQGVWYANILSGYGTHLKNIVSTFFNGMFYAASEFITDPSLLPILMVGGLKGAKRGFVEAWHTVQTGRSPIHVLKIETPWVLERKQFIGGFYNPYNWLKFVGRLMAAEDVLQFQALKEMRATQLAYREAKKAGHKNPFSKETWKIINDKLLGTAESVKEAKEQSTDEGLTDAAWQRRVYELIEQNRPIQMTEQAYGFAAKGTFNHQSEGTLGAITNAIASVLDIPIGGVKPLRFVVPFTRILTNVVNNTLDFTPVGFIRAARGVRGFESLESFHPTKGAYKELTQEERRQLVGRASLGVGLTAAMYALTKIPCKDGHNILEITGGGTGDYGKDLQLRQGGWQSYSIRICGGDYLSYKLTPMVFNLGFIGNMNDHEKYDSGASEESLAKKTMLAAWETAGVMTDMTWIGTTSNLMQSLSEKSPEAGAKKFLRSLESSGKQLIVPNIFSQSSQKVQDIFNMPQKQANNAWGRLIQDIPVARNTLNDKINALGEPIVRDTDLFISSETKDPVWKYLNDKTVWVSTVNKNSVIVFDAESEQDRPSTNDEYYEFSKLRGEKIKAELERLLIKGANVTVGNSTEHKTAEELNKGELSRIITNISTQATTETKEELFYKKEKKKIKITIKK